MSRRGHSQLPVEERMRVVLAVLSGELTIAEAARRHGTTGKTVAEWRDRFLEAGQAGLENMMPGPGGRNGTSIGRRQRAEIGASFMTHPPAATGSGKPTSASSRPRPAASGGSAR